MLDSMNSKYGRKAKDWRNKARDFSRWIVAGNSVLRAPKSTLQSQTISNLNWAPWINARILFEVSGSFEHLEQPAEATLG